jgi:hypothetical protein
VFDVNLIFSPVFALQASAQAMTFYDLSAVDIHGVPQKLSQYSGQVTLVVNVATF